MMSKTFGTTGNKIDSLIQDLQELAQAHKIGKLVLFGSRARGDCQERSDVDLAIFGVSREKALPFLFAVEELPTLLKFDLVVVDEDTDPVLLDEISRDGVSLYVQ